MTIFMLFLPFCFPFLTGGTLIPGKQQDYDKRELLANYTQCGGQICSGNNSVCCSRDSDTFGACFSEGLDCCGCGSVNCCACPSKLKCIAACEYTTCQSCCTHERDSGMASLTRDGLLVAFVIIAHVLFVNA